jgi:hypothetical protein
MSTERIVTVHAGTDLALQLALLDAIDRTLRDHGVHRTWIDPGSRSELVVMAEMDDPVDDQG